MVQYFNSYLLYPFLEKRQNRDIRSKVSALERFDKLSHEQQKEQIKQKLYYICNEASLHVPYYRELFRQIGFDPQSILEDIKNIEQTPYLTKEIIREQGDRLFSDKYPRHTLHERKTGGSTGVSTLIYYSQEALDWTAASNLHAISWTGKKRHMREVHFSSLFPETFPFRDRVKEAIKCMALNRTNITTHAFNDADLALIVKQIKQAKPYFVEGHPSTIYAVAQYLSKQYALKKPLFSVFESTGEVLDHKKRESIEKYLGCRVYDRYGSAEFGVIAHETDDSAHKLKVLESMVYPELFVTEDYNELVLTGLTNTAMPLIRYRTGDMVTTLEKSNETTLIGGIIGRSHDMVTVGDKTYPTHYLQDLLDRIGGIVEFQVYNKTENSIVLRLVAPNEAIHDSVVSRLKSWWGEHVDVEFIGLDDLEKVGWREKFRYLIQNPTTYSNGSQS